MTYARLILYKRCLKLMITGVICLALLCGCASASDAPENITESTEPANTEAAITIESSAESTKEQTTETTVPADTEPPVITGAEVIFASVGSPLKYKSYIYVSDDTDDDVDIRVDNSEVDLARTGEYNVTYYATDKAGNTSSFTAVVKVQEQTEPDVDDATIYAKADKILESIITEDMTDLEKVFAVFYHVRDTYGYWVGREKWSYKQEAYLLMTEMSGTCYSNSCLSQILFERLGIDSIMVTGTETPEGTHYWNLVTLDGGQNWYIYDSIWMTDIDEYPMCMMTASFARDISERYNFNYDTDRDYPKVSDIPAWTIEDYENDPCLSPYRLAKEDCDM